MQTLHSPPVRGDSHGGVGTQRRSGREGHAATDADGAGPIELGFQAAVYRSFCYDVLVTALFLLGLNYEQLSFYNNGIARRLTGVHGQVIQENLA